MPPALASRFTTGELAVLRIVADEFQARQICCLCLDAIAARAGVSRTLAKNAIKQARRLGMVEVRERRRTGAKSLPNVVTVIDREWLGFFQYTTGSIFANRNQDKKDWMGEYGNAKVFDEKAEWLILHQDARPYGTETVLGSEGGAEAATAEPGAAGATAPATAPGGGRGGPGGRPGPGGPPN